MSDPVSLEDQLKIDEARDRQLAARGALGAFVYPIVYCLVAYPTELNQRHPQIHALIIAIFLILATARISMCLRFTSLYSKNRTLWRTSFIASVAGLGTLWGLVSAYAVTKEPWAPATLLLLFAGSGLSGGMIATVAIAATLVADVQYGINALAPESGREALLALPLLLASVGLVCSVLGIILVNALRGMGPERALELGHQISAVLLIIAAWFLSDYLGAAPGSLLLFRTDGQ